MRTAAREYLIEESLTRLEQEFQETFVRVHRNCLVARAAIRGFEREGGESGEGSPRFDLGLQMNEDVTHRLIDVWATGEAAAR